MWQISNNFEGENTFFTATIINYFLLRLVKTECVDIFNLNVICDYILPVKIRLEQLIISIKRSSIKIITSNIINIF